MTTNTNEIKVNGVQEFMGREIPVIIGGFGANNKCVTDKMIAEIHSIQARHVRETMNRNFSRFKRDIDFIDLKQRVDGNDTLDLTKFGYAKQAITQASNIYLLSERGYAKLIKIMDSDLAWEIHDKMIDEYFTMREVIKSSESLKADLLMSIYKGGVEGITATKMLIDLEMKPLVETIEVQKPKVEFAENVLISANTFTTTQIAKDYHMSAMKFNALLKELGIQYKSNGQWVLTSKYQDKGYMESNTYEGEKESGEHWSRMASKWTQEGRKFLYEKLRRIGHAPAKVGEFGKF